MKISKSLYLQAITSSAIYVIDGYLNLPFKFATVLHWIRNVYYGLDK